MKKPAVGIGGLEMAGNDGWEGRTPNVSPASSPRPCRRNRAQSSASSRRREHEGILTSRHSAVRQYKGWAIENLPDGWLSWLLTRPVWGSLRAEVLSEYERGRTYEYDHREYTPSLPPVEVGIRIQARSRGGAKMNPLYRMMQIARPTGEFHRQLLERLRRQDPAAAQDLYNQLHASQRRALRVPRASSHLIQELKLDRMRLNQSDPVWAGSDDAPFRRLLTMGEAPQGTGSARIKVVPSRNLSDLDRE